MYSDWCSSPPALTRLTMTLCSQSGKGQLVYRCSDRQPEGSLHLSLTPPPPPPWVSPIHHHHHHQPLRGPVLHVSWEGGEGGAYEVGAAWQTEGGGGGGRGMSGPSQGRSGVEWPRTRSFKDRQQEAERSL